MFISNLQEPLDLSFSPGPTDPVHIKKGELIAEIDENTIAKLDLIYKQAFEETRLAEEKLKGLQDCGTRTS
ncbi:MAG: hypothetical protein CM1200mP3_17300 [Chloroflexota bacterium]|nr:MAG: hypothetical protein CM1200mP3_17300 [Chloroflexota bacterium]